MNAGHQALLEEILCAMFLCAGFLAHQSGAMTWAKVLWGKAAMDMACALFYWVKEIAQG